MATLRFDELEVYKEAEHLAARVWVSVLKWDSLARDTVGKQLIRAADSVGATISEGCGRGNYRDTQRFVRIACGSVNETRDWLRRAFNRNLLSKKSPEQGRC